MAYVREPVAQFAREMEAQLRANAWKSGWNGCLGDYLWDRTFQEMLKLRDALKAAGNPPTIAQGKRITKEAADAANFLMMIADNYGDDNL